MITQNTITYPEENRQQIKEGFEKIIEKCPGFQERVNRAYASLANADSDGRKLAMKTLCGFRPTGRLHLGHYFAVIKPGRDGADVLIANYHAPEENGVEKSMETLEKYGVKKTKLQKDCFNPDLFFKLLCLAKVGDLSRMTQYKSSSDDERTAQLLTYPVLMTHDVAGYQEVVVGEDQEQHLEYARKLLNKYNKVYPEVTIPVSKVVVGRIKDLRNPENKMSKSNPDGCLFLDDSPDEIRYKLKKATATPQGLNNLIFLYEEFVGGPIPQRNQELKERLAEKLIAI